MSSEKYTPPYKVSGKAMSLIAEIAVRLNVIVFCLRDQMVFVYVK